MLRITHFNLLQSIMKSFSNESSLERRGVNVPNSLSLQHLTLLSAALGL